MTYVVTENCDNCKYTDCVEVCPVDAFHEGETMLYINPETCIDCDACVSECPVEAIFAEEDVPEEHESAIEFNKSEAERLQGEGVDAITEKMDALDTAEARKAELGF